MSAATDRQERYAQAALDGALAAVRAAGPGGRNQALNTAAYSLGRLVGGGLLSVEEAEAHLLAAALETGETQAKAISTIRRGLRAGADHPRTLDATDIRTAPGRREWATTNATTPARAEPAPRPNADEVAELWRSAVPVTDDAEAVAWLKSRGLDVGRVADFGLARVVPMGVELPAWAAFKGRPWTKTGHRLVVRAFEPDGRLGSLHARCLHSDVDPADKAAWPAAGPGSSKGLVFADAGAHLLLTEGAPPWWNNGRHRVVVAEGVPDFFTWATKYSDTDEDAPAVFGMTAGGWGAEVAARVPAGAVVVITTHADEAGDRYAETVRVSLASRCKVNRWKPKEGTP